MRNEKSFYAMNSRDVRRGQIWITEWEPHRGSEQGGVRPSLVIQSDNANELRHYQNTIVATMSTSPAVDALLHIAVEPSRLNGLDRPGIVRCEQILTISRTRLIRYIGQIEPPLLEKVDEAIKIVLGLK